MNGYVREIQKSKEFVKGIASTCESEGLPP